MKKFTEEILNLLDSGMKIDAIKKLRKMIAGMSIAECKKQVEYLAAQRVWQCDVVNQLQKVFCGPPVLEVSYVFACANGWKVEIEGLTESAAMKISGILSYPGSWR